MKESFYFPHDTNAIQDPKLLMLLSKCGLDGIGLYWILIEILHQDSTGKIDKNLFDNYIEFYSKHQSGDSSFITNVKQMFNTTKLFVEHEGFIYSERVLRNKETRNLLSEKRSIAGLKSAEIRKKLSVSTSVEQKLTSVEQGKEKKRKEIKEINPVVLSIYNLYPKKVDRGHAFKAIASALKKTTVEILEAAVKKYAESVVGKDLQYIPNPATWFNGERWLDEEKTEKHKKQEVLFPHY